MAFFDKFLNAFGSSRALLRRKKEEFVTLRKEMYRLASGLYNIVGEEKPGLFYCSHVTDESLPAYTAGEESGVTTLTGNVNGALTITGVLVSQYTSVLVKDAVDPRHNGIYRQEAVTDGSVPWKLKRHTWYDQNSEFPQHPVFVMTTVGARTGSRYQLVTPDVILGVSKLEFVELHSVRRGECFWLKKTVPGGANAEVLWKAPGLGNYYVADMYLIGGGSGTTSDQIQVVQRKSSDLSETAIASFDISGVSSGTVVRPSTISNQGNFVHAPTYDLDLVLKGVDGGGNDRPAVTAMICVSRV